MRPLNQIRRKRKEMFPILRPTVKVELTRGTTKVANELRKLTDTNVDPFVVGSERNRFTSE